MTRDEHLAWCKQRALEYLDKGDAKNAVASMESDMCKHPDTQISDVLSMLGMRYLIDGDHAAVRRWIEGFR
jgi:hypothetical protein